jgi:hypothetical protein
VAPADAILRLLAAALILGLLLVSAGFILELRSQEAGVDLVHDAGWKLRPWDAERYAGRRHSDRIGRPYPWRPDWRPRNAAEYRLAVEAGWHAPADWWPGFRDDEELRAAGLAWCRCGLPLGHLGGHLSDTKGDPS